jgi:hypothetical protein
MPAKSKTRRKSAPARATTPRKPAPRKPGAKAKSRPARRGAGGSNGPVSRRPSGRSAGIPPLVVSRATLGYDDDEVLPMGGGRAGFGRCGGRLISTEIEQSICNALSSAGVIHSHSPRHFEVKVREGSVAAYAPMIVLRGRGREGKTVVIEAAGEADAPTIEKIQAFRAQYTLEFYVIFVAPEGVVDDVSPQAYDECAATDELTTLINRLAD